MNKNTLVEKLPDLKCSFFNVKLRTFQLMPNLFNLLFILIFTTSCKAQTNSFDVFTYTPPAYFTKSEMLTSVQWSMKNNDTSFCIITIYKSQPVKDDLMKDVMTQWNEQVVKQLTKANKKPLKILAEQLWDGWASTLAISNFYQHKKMRGNVIFI